MSCDNGLLADSYRYLSRGEKGRPIKRVSHEEEESLQRTVRKHRDYEICTKVDDENFQLIILATTRLSYVITKVAQLVIRGIEISK